MQNERHRISEISAGVSCYKAGVVGRQPSMNEKTIGGKVKRPVGQLDHRHTSSGRADSQGIHGSERADVVVADLAQGDSPGRGNEVEVGTRPGRQGEGQKKNDESRS